MAEEQKYKAVLTELGLTKDQSDIYEVLVKKGPLSVGKIKPHIAISRPLIYKNLMDLRVLELVTKEEESGKVARFVPAHPSKLKELLNKKMEQMHTAQSDLNGIFGSILSDFNIATGRPGIRVFEGIKGIGELYEDIVNEGKDILLFRSPNDNNHPELRDILHKYIGEQVQAGIHVKALTPLMPDTPKKIFESDQARLVTRRIMPRDKFFLSSQIVIYGDKVGIIGYATEPVIITIIENKSISDTMRVIFDYIWDISLLEHEKLYQAIIAR